MLRNILIGTFSAILVVAIGTAAYNTIGAQAQGAGDTSTVGVMQGSGNPQGNGGQGAQAASQSATGTQDHAAELAAIPASELNEEEAAALLYMYEEEKLARDVYNTLYATWNIPTFQNIASSEQMHMDAVKTLLDRYGLTAPELAPGSFADASLQNLYTALVAQGSQSIGDALKVGAAIEEIDILDLQTRLAATDNTDIQMIYQNLVKGSNSHLQAFSNALLNQTGETYQPQYMSAEMYAAAIAATQGNGHAGSNGNAGANGSQQTQADLVNVTSLHGTVSAYQYGMLTIVSDDGQTVGVQISNQNYATSLGFAPTAGQGLTVTGFTGSEGLFTATQIVMDDGSTYTFREGTSGRPAWAGGKGNGGDGGGNH